MTPERWQRVREVFEQALETPAESRAALLDEVCGGDAEMRAEVESLLQHHEQLDDRFLAPRAVKLCLTPERPDPWVESLIGRKIGRYAVTRLIGHGGMGCVFEARQEQPARTVALKLLQPGFSSRSALARFRLEPEVLGRLQHPNVAQVFEAGVHEGEHGAVPYFAMEFIPNAQSLIEYAGAHELTTRQRLELFAKVCDAVHHGHQKGIIHRDIKPANILVGAGGEPKVIDFGVARASDADVAMTTQCTHVGDLVGTVHYMSPEQCDGDPATIDTRSDIYSLGVVLYELLTGAAPYDTSGTTVYGAIRVIKQEPPQPPSAVDRQLRGDVEAILLKALEKDPGRRYASVAALAQDIQRNLKGEPVEARRPGRVRRALLWAMRYPRTAAVASAVVFFGLIGLAILISVNLYVRYYFEEPVGLSADASGLASEVHLLNRRGMPVHSWRAGANGSVRAWRVTPFLEEPERRLVLIGYHTASALDRAGELRAYDMRGDFDRPLWVHRVQPDDLPQPVRDQGSTVDQFNPAAVWSFDVLPELAGQRLEEIVCQFSHNNLSWRELCVLRATDGKLLQRFWHDGSFECHWLPGPQLLIAAGENWEKPPHQRGCPESPTSRLPVVFAIRPSLGAGVLEPELIDSSQLTSFEYVVWYKWLSVCPIPGIDWSWQVTAPPDGDPSRIALLGLNIETQGRCGIMWRIDANGDRIPNSLVAPRYAMARTSDSRLPPADSFRLQDNPPGE